MTGQICLGDDDTIELAELIEFLHDWIGFHRLRAGQSLDLFTAGGYDLDELRADLARFAFLLGGDGNRFVHGTDP